MSDFLFVYLLITALAWMVGNRLVNYDEDMEDVPAWDRFMLSCLGGTMAAIFWPVILAQLGWARLKRALRS